MCIRTLLAWTELKRPSNMAESCLCQASAFRFHVANLDGVRCRIGDRRECKPARNISHPWEKLDKVGSWVCGTSETLDEVVNKFDVVILPGFYGRLIINNRQNHRCGGTAKMLIPFRGVAQSIRSENESLFCLRPMEVLHDTLVESLMGSLAHPTPASDGVQYKGRTQIQSEARTCRCIG